MKNYRIAAATAAALLLITASCNSLKEVAYIQDIDPENPELIAEPKDIRLMPQDKISIIVNSKDPELANLFNLPIVNMRVGSTTGITNNNTGYVSGYTLDDNGEIDFPVLGKVKVEGLTRVEVSELIKNRLIEENLVQDPVVTVEFMNLSISVIGEVKAPGKYNITKDRINIMDALSMAGDLTVFGVRDRVIVLREQDGKEYSYIIDMKSAKSIYSSPVFYLQQNDIIYVQPNATRAGQSDLNENSLKSVSLWLTIASVLASVATTVGVLMR